MKNRDTINVYCAIDIARILVRNPEEVVDLLTYEHICETYGQGRALDDLPEHERIAMLSLEAACDELQGMGFAEDQIAVMVALLHQSFEEINIRALPADMVEYTYEKQMLANAFGVVAFPYGPPIVLHSPHHALKSRGYSLSATRTIMDCLTSRLATLLMEKRLEWPELLSANPVGECGHHAAPSDMYL